MAHAFDHAQSSARRWGGNAYDFLPIHRWIDASKVALADHRHRALRHHSLGVFWCEEQFGVTILTSEGVEVPVRSIAEQHIIEDLGFVPTVQDWLQKLPKQFWMTGKRLNLKTQDETTDSTTAESSGHDEVSPA